MQIAILLGSAREGRVSDKAANYIKQRAELLGHQATIADVAKILPADTHEKISSDPSWSKTMSEADALIIVSPEYNHGYPGPLKDALDSLGDEGEYTRKPVVICGTSAGGMGGVRAVEQLRQVCTELSLVVLANAVYFSNHFALWNEDGSIKDAGYDDRTDTMLAALAWYAQVLKTGRTEVPFPEKKAK